MEKLKNIKILIESMEADFAKFYLKDNHAAGVRIRQGMQELKNQANEIRIEIQEMKKGK